MLEDPTVVEIHVIGPPGPAGDLSSVADRDAVALLPPSVNAVYLREAGRQGIFQWQWGNLAAQVAADTQQGVYVPPTGQNGSTGAWVRDYSGPMMASWFGAVPDGVTDNSLPMNGMIALLKAVGGNGCFNDTGSSGTRVYRTGRILIQGPLTGPFGLHCDPDVWLEKATDTAHNMIDIFGCEDVTLGNLNINCRYSTLAITSTGYGLTLKDCSDVSHYGKIRVHDFQEAILVYTTVVSDPPTYHDVTFDYLELHAVIGTDAAGHVISGGLAIAGIVIVNMRHSGARFVDVVGVMTADPGFAIEFKADCRDCWFGGYVVKQCMTAVSALGTGTAPGDPVVDIDQCWFGPGLIDQCKIAVGLSHARGVTFAHLRARFHPDGLGHDATGFPWFIQIAGLSTDCTVIAEVIDYDGGPDDVPPIHIGNDRNIVIVPTINNAVPVYASVAADHCAVHVWHDASLNSTADLGAKFVDTSGGITNNYSVGGAGFAWRAGTAGGVKIDNNQLSVRADGGVPSMFGDGYISLAAEHFNIGVNVLVPISGFNQQIPGHVGIYVLEPAGVLAAGTLKLPVTPGDGQQQTIVSTQTVTALTLTPGSGHSIVGAVTTLAANTPVRYVFNLATLKWYRA